VVIRRERCNRALEKRDQSARQQNKTENCLGHRFSETLSMIIVLAAEATCGARFSFLGLPFDAEFS
jgi:hypothetical protein